MRHHAEEIRLTYRHSCYVSQIVFVSLGENVNFIHALL
jgi:hypothetical protein